MVGVRIHGLVRTLALLAAMIPVLGIVGCGDDALWARWCAERALYRAHTRAERVKAHPDAAGPSEWDGAERALARVAELYPVDVWLARGAGPARQVASASGHAWLELARLQVARGRDSIAVATFVTLAAWQEPMPGLAIEALAGEAAAAEHRGDFDAQLAALSALSRIDPLADREQMVPAPVLLDAPLAVAREWRARTRVAIADSVLEAADARFAAVLPLAAGPAVAPLAEALARIRVARGDGEGALAALHIAFNRSSKAERPTRLLAMAQSALDTGLEDSVKVYAREAARLDGSSRIAGRALLLEAQAWTRRGTVDSALAAYFNLLNRWPDPGAIGPQARYEHALLLDQVGRWEAARPELFAVAARYPTHPLAFAALGYVVEHDLRHGNVELAQVTGATELDKLTYQLATNRDPDVQRQARTLRAELQLALGRTGAAESTYVELWREFPADSLAEAGALRAARLAEHRPGGAERAARLYRQLSVQARSAAVRQAAATAATSSGLAH